ncbi:hypothetical protein AGDE_07214 [Angomonas deanei]|uniref:Cyclin, N-terminal domain containing protein n=1 Tax=Angomonas deanei TaxID=59799 RepID=S9UYA4_9TRYP|nr:hypothetical protein AGDE_12224 [Angomonas deanei]EPY35837.1 hypothetical protein AGDE_07214 [Angomonas deanei]CAD2218669.1 hypothetical protein, conserved [Angomonas deanei]|eukprot:EPY24683.1 hypothetical protein AGDE_12224 [Angomonas deanei]
MPHLIESQHQGAEENKTEAKAPVTLLLPSEKKSRVLFLLSRRLLHNYALLDSGDVSFFTSPCEEDCGDEMWLKPFGHGAILEHVIFHLFANNECFDVSSWFIALALLERLHTHFFATPCHEERFQVSLNHIVQLFFSLYCVAFKFHFDFPVHLSYVTGLLPHSQSDRNLILKRTVRDEKRILNTLGFSCFVSPDNLAQLAHVYLRREELLWLI